MKWYDYCSKAGGSLNKFSSTEVLEALERGEMKFESNGCVLSCSEDEDEDEEVDPLSIDAPTTTTVGTVKVGVDELSQLMRCCSVYEEHVLFKLQWRGDLVFDVLLLRVVCTLCYRRDLLYLFDLFIADSEPPHLPNHRNLQPAGNIHSGVKPAAPTYQTNSAEWPHHPGLPPPHHSHHLHNPHPQAQHKPHLQRTRVHSSRHSSRLKHDRNQSAGKLLWLLP